MAFLNGYTGEDFSAIEWKEEECLNEQDQCRSLING